MAWPVPGKQRKIIPRQKLEHSFIPGPQPLSRTVTHHVVVHGNAHECRVGGDASKHAGIERTILNCSFFMDCSGHALHNLLQCGQKYDGHTAAGEAALAWSSKHDLKVNSMSCKL